MPNDDDDNTKISDKSIEATSNASACMEELYLFTISCVQTQRLKKKMRLDRLVSDRGCMLSVRFIGGLHRILNQTRSFAEHKPKFLIEKRLNQAP